MYDNLAIMIVPTMNVLKYSRPKSSINGIRLSFTSIHNALLSKSIFPHFVC